MPQPPQRILSGGCLLSPAMTSLIDHCNRLSRLPDAGIPFAPVRLSYDPIHHIWWIQDALKKDAGWGYAYRTLDGLCRRWHIQLTAYDATTGVWHGIPVTP